MMCYFYRAKVMGFWGALKLVRLLNLKLMVWIVISGAKLIWMMEKLSDLKPIYSNLWLLLR